MQFCFGNISLVLLLQYQRVSAAQDQPKAAAPSATTYELEVSKASTSSSSWADAALAGLPPDDEAVQMAELAATAGRSLEVLSYCIPAQVLLCRVIDRAVPLHIKDCCFIV